MIRLNAQIFYPSLISENNGRPQIRYHSANNTNNWTNFEDIALYKDLKDFYGARSYVVSYSNNASFNSSADTITISLSSTITDVDGNIIDLTELKLGDNVFVRETDVPDRWVGSITSTNVVFYKMETTKVDLTNYYTKTETDTLLSGYYLKTETYSKNEVNSLLANYYTQTQINSMLTGYQPLIDSSHKLDYSLIANTPTIGNGILTIQKNNTTIDTFSANQTGNTTINITVPTNTSDLNNDSGFITSSALSDYLPLAGGTMTGTINAQDITPKTGGDGTYNLGSKLFRWNQIWGKHIVSRDTTPNFSTYIEGESYTTTPNADKYAQYLARDDNGNFLGGIRFFHRTSNHYQVELFARHHNTGYSSLVCFETSANATSSGQASYSRFKPGYDNKIDLGNANAIWQFAYSREFRAKNVSYAYTDTPSSNSWIGKFATIDKNGAALSSMGAGIGTDFNAIELGVNAKNGTYGNVRVFAKGLSNETPKWDFRPAGVASGTMELGQADARWKTLYTNNVCNWGSWAARGCDDATTMDGWYKLAECSIDAWYRGASATFILTDVDDTSYAKYVVYTYVGNNGAVNGYCNLVEYASSTARWWNRVKLVTRQVDTTVYASKKTYEIWYRQNATYNRVNCEFINENIDNRSDDDANNLPTKKWTKYYKTNSNDKSYRTAAVVDLTNGYIPNASFTEATFNVDGYTATTITGDCLNSAIGVSLATANIISKFGENNRTDTPSSTITRANYFYDKNGIDIGRVGYEITSSSNRLVLGVGNKASSVVYRFVYVGSWGNAWSIVPSSNNEFDLGSSSNRFKDLYLGGKISNGTYDYTLPSATGTLALTSSTVTASNYIKTIRGSFNLSSGVKTFTANSDYYLLVLQMLISDRYATSVPVRIVKGTTRKYITFIQGYQATYTCDIDVTYSSNNFSIKLSVTNGGSNTIYYELIRLVGD